MSVLTHISNGLIPFLFIFIIGYALIKHIDIFDIFTEGAIDGFKTVVNILPTLIGLMVAVGILRTSGCLSYLADAISPIADVFGFPSELVPLAVVKMFSSSAASGLLTDIYKSFGPDSYTGLLASVMMSCSETIFYTMSVYFVTAGVTKSRYTLAGALTCTLAGIIASAIIVAGAI